MCVAIWEGLSQHLPPKEAWQTEAWCCVRIRRVLCVQYDISDYREHLYAEILRRRKELKHADRAARDRAKGRSRSYKSSAAVHDSHAANGSYYH